MAQQPVFYDPRQAGWKRLRRIFELAALAFTFLVIFFIYTALRSERLPDLLLPIQKRQYHALKDFFSGRRRHTRFSRDWSSDVCFPIFELVRRQWSGNAHAVIKGIGVVNCVYVNPETDQFWIIDYRLYDPDGDSKTKLDHMREMLTN